ncbi:MAG: aminotransferase DegT [Deltaproteobacteria bacterium]|nr:MAG: aminotransferase DegT [Deltaproteobacteria bacterium]
MNFRIGFEKEDRKTVFGYWDSILTNQQWTEGKYTRLFEEKWAEYVGCKYAVAFNSWFGAALAALEYFGVRGRSVICPSNTFIATPLAIVKAGGSVLFQDCGRHDLCLQLPFSERDAVGVFLVHIGGHLAFDVERISDYCKAKGLFLIEDCAHAHGADWNGRKAGTWGDCGIYSFYATKTITTGEGGMLVTDNEALCEFAKQYRNYGKFSYQVKGGNYRMSEFTAALGVVQTNRVDDIVAWKNEYVERNYKGEYSLVQFPPGMTSGYYKCITFNRIENSTGKVYDQPCHRLMKKRVYLPNTEWVAKNHWCLPVFYKGGELESA